MAFVVRYIGDEALFVSAVRGRLRKVNPVLLAKFETLDQAITRLSAGSRFNGVLLGSFATIAFLMAVLGVYGVLAFSAWAGAQCYANPDLLGPLGHTAVVVAIGSRLC